MSEGRHEAGGVRLFFAFPDGAFHYVCAECSALCCRGNGFSASASREIAGLLPIYPALGSLAVGREIDEVSFMTPAGGCFFLRPDELCQIEVEHGHEAKPTVCRLFPFNGFSRVGKVVVVTPHFMCPLRLQAPPMPGEVEGTHAELEEEIRSSGVLDPATMKVSLPQARLHVDLTPTAAITREERFRDRASEALGRERFADLLARVSDDSDALDERVARGARLLGVPTEGSGRPRDSVDDVLVALASPLRMHLLSLTSEAALAALVLGEHVLRHVNTLPLASMTLQNAYSVLESAMPEVRLLARGDEPLEISRSAKLKAPTFGVPQMVFGTHRFWRHFASDPRTLTALEASVSPSLGPADRTVLLGTLGSQMDRVILKRRRRT